MTRLEIVKWLHLLGAATWTGGLLTLAALVPAMRRAGVERHQLQATARQFGRVSWVAMAVAVTTGLVLRSDFGIPWDDPTLSTKLGLVVFAIVLALTHQLTARRTSAAVRGAVQGVVLVVSVSIFAVAVTL